MSGFLDQLAPWAAQVGLNSLKAIPLILLLALMQRWARRWLSPRAMMMLWFLAVARLVLPGAIHSPANVYDLAKVLPAESMKWMETTGADVATSMPRAVQAMPSGDSLGDLVAVIWLLGVLIAAGILLIQTVRFHFAFTRLRPCTDTVLLDLLEDEKERAGVRTPISLVVSDEIHAPVLYGFIRPRLLLPAALTRTLGPGPLRYIFQHEIAHVNRWDIAVNWLVCAVGALHWFNPAVWLMAQRMARIREMATDRAVLARRNEPGLYGEVMLRVAELSNVAPLTAGAAGIVENKSAMKERIEMLSQSYGKIGSVVSVGIALVLGVLFLSEPLQADGPNDAAIADAVKVSDAWLPVIDAGKYAESYNGFCVVAKTALAQDTWVKKNEQVRTPLGKLQSRTLKSRQYLTALPEGAQGQFVILQYETVYQNLNATETVTTMLDKDGQWRIAGYYIRPR